MGKNIALIIFIVYLNCVSAQVIPIFPTAKPTEKEATTSTKKQVVIKNNKKIISVQNANLLTPRGKDYLQNINLLEEEKQEVGNYSDKIREIYLDAQSLDSRLAGLTDDFQQKKISYDDATKNAKQEYQQIEQIKIHATKINNIVNDLVTKAVVQFNKLSKTDNRAKQPWVSIMQYSQSISQTFAEIENHIANAKRYYDQIHN